MIGNLFHSWQSLFNYSNYWKMRQYCQCHHNLLQKMYLFRLRRIENRQCASTGLGLNTPESPMCIIYDKLILPHRLNNIIIARNVVIGENVTIYQNVTIAEEDKSKKTIIGNNVMIGAGAVILNNVTIGERAIIGANAVITKNIPAGGVAIGNPARIIRF